MENGPFIVDLPIEMVIFHSYVSLPEGMLTTSKEMCVALSHAFQTNHRPYHRQHLLQVTIEILLIYGIFMTFYDSICHQNIW